MRQSRHGRTHHRSTSRLDVRAPAKSARRLWAFALAALVGLAPAACSDDSGGPDVGTNNTNNTNTGVCDQGDTLSFVLNDPTPASGFAPLNVELNGSVSPIQDVDYSWVIDFGDGSQQSGTNSQPTAIKGYETSGTFTVTLTVTDQTCNKEYPSTSVTVDVLAPVELEGEDLTGRPGNVEVGGEMRVTMDVLNSSANDLNLPVDVHFFLSATPGVAFDQTSNLTPLFEETLDGGGGTTIAAGDRASIDRQVTVPDTLSTGSYYIIAVIDPNDTVGEGDDQRNNVVASTGQVFIENTLEDAPDLFVDQVQIGPATAFRQLSSITLNADIRNIGNRFADGVEYAVYTQIGSAEFDPGTAREIFRGGVPDTGAIDFQPPNNLFALRGQQLVVDPPIALEEDDEPVEVYVFVVADPDNTIREESPEPNVDGEANNVGVSQTAVQLSNEAQNGVDIVLVNFGFAPAATFLDGTVQISLEVGNYGTEDSRSFFCSIYLSEDDALDPQSDERLTNINFSNIAPSNETFLDQRIATVPGFFDTGEYYAFAYCDPFDAVRETVEDNNIVRLTDLVTITAEAVIDLTAEDVTLSADSVEDGGNLELNATITNSGLNGAGPSTIRVRRSLDGTITSADPIIAEIDIDPIGPESELDVTIPLNELFCDIFQDQYSIGIQIDARNQVNETQESNNLIVLSDALNITGPRCTCAEDDFEDNDAPANASPITEGLSDGLALCSGGELDYYRVNLTQGQSLFVDATLVHEGDNTNLDLRILDPNFQPINDATSNTDTLNERATLFLIQQPGDYLIEVKGRGAMDVNEYSLDIDITTPSPGIDLSPAELELSDTNPALAALVTSTVTTLNTANDAAGAYDVRVVLSQDDVVDQTDFTLLTTRIEDGLSGATVRTDDFTTAIPVEATEGTYRICVVLDANDEVDELDEDNNVLCSPEIEVDTSCYDPFEANDDFDNPTELEPGDYVNLTVCDNGRVDIYRFCALNGQRVEVNADFIHRDGDVELVLYQDIEGTPSQIDASTTVRDTEMVEVDYVNGDQCYFLEVSLKDPLNIDPDGANTYALSLIVEQADPTLACIDPFEPNNEFDAAEASGADLLQVINEDITLDRCPQNDADYFYVDLVAGPEITLCATNSDDNPQDYNLNIALFDPARQSVTAQGGRPDPCITTTLTVSGRYYVRVLATDRTRRSIRYNLSLDGLFGVDLVGRDFTVEPNDIIPGESILLYDFVLQNARTERAESIRYSVYYSPDGPIIEPDSDLLLGTNVIGGLDGFTSIVVTDALIVPDDPAFQSGEGYIGVFLDPDDTIDEVNEGNNRLFAPVNVLVCDDDPFVGNQSVLTAAPIEADTPLEGLAICPGTEDWYCGELPAGDYRASAGFIVDPDNRLDTDLNISVISINGMGQTLDEFGTDLSIGNDSNVDFTLFGDTTVCVNVFPLRNTAQNTYSLAINTLDGDPGVDLVLSNLATSPDVVTPGTTPVDYSFTLRNSALDEATDVRYRVYFSEDADITPGDFLLDEGLLVSVPGLSQETITDGFTWPVDPSFTNGPGFIGVLVDPDDQIAENDETNNAAANPVTVLLPGACLDDGFEGNQDVANAADGALNAGLNDLVVCPDTSDWFCFDAAAAGDYRVSALFALDPLDDAGTDLDLRVVTVDDADAIVEELALIEEILDGAIATVTVAAPGRVCAEVFASGDGGTNTYSFLAEGPLDAPIDFTVANAVATPDADIVPGVTEVSIDFELNELEADAEGDVNVAFAYSQDDTLGPEDVAIGAGDFNDRGLTNAAFVIPDDPAVIGGPGFIFIIADDNDAYAETDEDNNVTSVAITIDRPVEPTTDLTVADAGANPAIDIEPGTDVEVSFTLDNLGDTDPAAASVSVYYSEDDTLGAEDMMLGSTDVTPFSTEPQNVTVTLPDMPAVVDGVGHILVIVDPDDEIGETDDTNNMFAIDITVLRAPVPTTDLIVTDAAGLDADFEPGVTTQTLTFNVDNLGDTDPAGDVEVTFYYSQDAMLEPGTDLLLGTATLTDITSPAAGSFDVTLPEDVAVLDGPGFVLVIVDSADAVNETDEFNNLTTVGINVTRPPVECTDDAFEGNQSLLTRQRVFYNVPANDLVICPGLDDWFCVLGVPPGDAIVEVTFTNDAGDPDSTDLDLEITNSNASEIYASDTTVGDNISLPVTYTEAGFCFRVYGHTPSSTNSYSLRVVPD